MKRILFILLVLPAILSAQWRISSGKLVPSDTTRTVRIQKVEADTVADERDAAGSQYIIIPPSGFSLATSSWGATLNDTITFYGVYIDKPLDLGEAAVTTQTLGGSCALRTFGMAVYNSAFERIDTTAATAWPGNGAGSSPAFVAGAVIGPGLYYFCFTTYNDGSCGQTFRAADISTNTVGLGLVTGQGTSNPIVGYATETLTVGAGWPATITPNKATTTVLFPYIVIIGSTLD